MIARLTIRQLLGQRRTLLIVILGLIPIGFALAFRASSHHVTPTDWTANTLFMQVIVGALLPFAALIFGTAALGTEFEDGTAIYLLAKPLPRWQIVASKLVVAWLATAAFLTVTALVSAAIALRGLAGGVVEGFVVAQILAALVYCAVFLALSIRTSHALIVGLIYAFVWEGLLTNLFTGLRLFSVREYTVGMAHAIAGVSNTVFTAHLAGTQSVAGLVVVGVIAIALAVRWLQRWQVSAST